ncbi:MAG: pyruvate dehydrogenase complex E1 component subunit beta [Pseudomonadota bacterium]
MTTEILMPALSPTMEEGKLAKWLVKEGDVVEPGDVIAEIETDKATMEVEAADGGKLGRILVAEGTEGVKVNTPIAMLSGEAGETNPTATQSNVAPVPSSAPGSQATEQAAPFAETAVSDAPHQAETSTTVRAQDAVVPSAEDTVHQSMREALRDAMAEEMRRDPDVFLMGEEVGEYQGAYKVSQGLLAEFGAKRVVDTPITEQGFAGIGVGAAFAGLKPIVEFMTWNFAMQAIDQIVNSAAKTRYMSGGQMACPIVFRGPNGAAARVGAQHSQCFSAWYAHVPGLKVVAPSTARDAKGLLRAAIRDPNPVLVLENEILYGATDDVPVDLDFSVSIGQARVARSGGDVTIVSFARGMVYALEAAERLAGDGIEAEVIDLRSLRPIDWPTILTSVEKTNRIVTVEEAWPVCSMGSEICAGVAIQAFDHLDAPPAKISGADVPMPYAANLEALALPTVAQVVDAAKRVCYV